MDFCITQNIRTTYTGKVTSLDAIVNVMRNSERLKADCENYLKQAGKKYPNQVRRIKHNDFPAFFPCAHFYGGKSTQDIIGLTGYGVIDIDNLEETQIAKILEVLKSEPHTVLAARSISGKGIHILYRYQFSNLEMPTVETMTPNIMKFTFQSVSGAICKFYKTLLNVEIDEDGLNVELQILISHDANVYYNKDAEPFVLEYVEYEMGKIEIEAFRIVENVACKENLKND